jgi:hypothetical protein
MPLIGMCTVVAMRLVQMRDDARANPEQIVEESEETIQVLAAAIGKPPETLRRKHGFLRGVAMLGGFFGRKCDLQPGWMTIARGWYELQTLMRGFEIGRAFAGQTGQKLLAPRYFRWDAYTFGLKRAHVSRAIIAVDGWVVHGRSCFGDS